MYLSRAAQYLILLLRVAIGWLFIYDGFMKFNSTTWNLLSEITGSHILPGFYNGLSSSAALPVLSQAYPILLIIAGAMILSGLWMRIGGGIAIVLLLLTYLPLLQFPHVGTTNYIVDYHIMYILVVALLLALHADQFWGLGAEVRINK